jgi:small GTP-binding protein
MSIKVVLLGNSGVGKTSIATRLTINKFNTGDSATIGGQFTNLCIDGMKINLWDTAGQERFRTLIPLYIRNAQIVIIVIDSNILNNHSEFIDTVEYWYKYANSQQLAPNHEFILVINKADIVDNLTVPKLYLTDTRFYQIILVSCFNGYNLPVLKDYLRDCSKKVGIAPIVDGRVKINNSGGMFSFCSIL